MLLSESGLSVKLDTSLLPLSLSWQWEDQLV